jgi:two-component system response regulator HydG
MRIAVPPLRARGNDVLLLAQHFVKLYSHNSGKPVVGLSSAVAERLLAYSWPGNVRELSNCIERAVAYTRFEQLSVEDLPEKIRDYRGANLAVPGIGGLEMISIEEVERRYILRVLEQLDGNKTAAAEVLGLDRRTLHRKLERYGESQERQADPPARTGT